MEYALNPIFQLLASSPQIHACIYLAHSIGMEETQILSVLIAKSTWYINHEYDEDGWFYCTQADLEQSTTYGRKTQQAAIKHLVDEGLIEYKVTGMPAKRYFRVLDAMDKISEFIRIGMEKYNGYDKEKHSKSAVNAEKSSMSKRDKQECPKGTNKDVPNGQARTSQTDKHTSKYNNKNNNNKKYNSSVSNEKESDNEEYTDSKAIAQIVSYLNEKAGTAYRPTGADTQKHIRARLAEGFSINDFIKVIDRKCQEWLNTDMAKYLRPSTLFGVKFESYLNAPSNVSKKDDDITAYESVINVLPNDLPNHSTVEEMLTEYFGGENGHG